MDKNDSMLEKNVWKSIAPYLTDKTGRTYTQNKESVKKADLIFEKLDDSLSDQQAEVLEEYFAQLMPQSLSWSVWFTNRA